MKLREIARLVDGEITGAEDVEIVRVAKIEEAGPGDITFLANLKYKKHVVTTRASAMLVSREVTLGDELLRRQAPVHLVKVADPYLAFLKLVETFNPPSAPPAAGIHHTAIVAKSATIADDAAIGAFAIVGEECSIGRGAALYAGTILGDRVTVGDRSILYEDVVVREGCTIGRHVVIHPGTVIGGDGFGFAPRRDGTYEKIPQRGNVVIEDDVEIGANCTVDRATIGETLIKRGAKLDNLIQVAHNVVIGENTVIAAQTGISGSTKIGNNCAIGGQVGFVGHVEIADRTMIGAQSGVPKSILEPGKRYFGYPALEQRESFKIQAVIHQLPALLAEIRNLQKRVEELEHILKERSQELK